MLTAIKRLRLAADDLLAPFIMSHADYAAWLEYRADIPPEPYDDGYAAYAAGGDPNRMRISGFDSWSERFIDYLDSKLCEIEDAIFSDAVGFAITQRVARANERQAERDFERFLKRNGFTRVHYPRPERLGGPTRT